MSKGVPNRLFIIPDHVRMLWEAVGGPGKPFYWNGCNRYSDQPSVHLVGLLRILEVIRILLVKYVNVKKLI